MVIKLSSESLYKINDQKNYYADMRRDVQLLLSHRAYTSLTTLIFCCLDALAAGSEYASNKDFQEFVQQHFNELCIDLSRICKPISGSQILYEQYRHGFAHKRGPKSRSGVPYSIAENWELRGAWADEVELEGIAGKFIAINIDLLAAKFVVLLNQLEADSALQSTLKLDALGIN